VPIYDGRASEGLPFTFSDEEFATLESRPVYMDNAVDVPLGSVVAVGYSLSLWPSDDPKNLSHNLQFIIVLS